LEIFLIVIIIVAVIAFIAYPLFITRRESLAAPVNPLEDLAAQRDSTYDAIRDLDFDYQLGKLSQTDYATLRDKYKMRAMQLLQQMDAMHGNDGADVDAEIESQVAQMRRAKEDTIESEVARLRRSKNDPIENQVAQMRAAKRSAARCKKCNTPLAVSDQFCSKCGTPVQRQKA
jgi:hypothetical protein